VRSSFPFWIIPAILIETAFGGELTGVQSSHHAAEQFSIIVLRFDEKPVYHLRQTNDGAGVEITIADCRVSPGVLTQIRSLRDALLKSAAAEAESNLVFLDFKFNRAVKIVERTTEKPFSLILDITPAPGAGKQPVAAADRKPTSAPPQKNTLESEAKPRLPAADVGTTSAPQSGNELEYGKKLLAAKREKEAYDAFRRALLENPRLVEAHYLLGLLARKWGQYDEAIGHFQAAKRDSIYARQALTELASIYRQLGRSSDEIEQWEEFFAASKNDQQMTAPAQDLPVAAADSSLAHPPPRPVEKGSSPLLYFLLLIVLILICAVALLYYKQRELHRTIAALLESGEEPESARKRPPPAEPEPPSQEDRETTEQARKAEETAREVQSLYDAGMSIPAIAEKLNMGQDEVRLILNLMREEKSKSPAEK
jgi:tetratricopeptide (TPR) repeat protein